MQFYKHHFSEFNIHAVFSIITLVIIAKVLKEKWGSFQGQYYFGVDLGIILGAVQFFLNKSYFSNV